MESMLVWRQKGVGGPWQGCEDDSGSGGGGGSVGEGVEGAVGQEAGS